MIATQMTTVEEVNEADHGRLAEFLASFEDEALPLEYWQRRLENWWRNNPAYDDTTPCGWMLIDDEQIVGFLGCIPTMFRVHGREQVCYGATTWRVEAPYRSESMKLMFSLLAATKGTIVYNTSPMTVLPIIEALGFIRLPWHGTTRHIYAIRPGSVLRSKLKRFGLLRYLSPLGGSLLSGMQSWRTMSLRKTDLVATEVEHASQTFDDLWQRTSQLFDNTLVRSAAVVNWYCFANPDCRKYLFACRDGERLLGYAIAWRYEKDGLMMFACEDLWLDPQANCPILALTRAMIDKGRELQCDLFQVAQFGPLVNERLAATGMFQLEVGPIPAYFKTSRTDAKQLAGETSYFTYLQGDYGL